MSIPNLETNTIYAVHLRSPSSSGGKDWIGAVTSTGEIHTYWGKTGAINQHAAKVGNSTKLQEIIREKVQKGYSQIDEYDPGQGWFSQRQQTQPAAATDSMPTPPPKPTGPPVNLLKVQGAKRKLAPTAAVAGPLNWDF
jgi:hypothetical protein